MKKILRNMFLFVALLCAVGSQAQTGRYLDSIFASVTVDTNIVYGLNKSYLTGFAATDSLRMDVYRPTGDTATNRPVIILMHAGSYLPGALTGFDFADKKENCIVELCTRYAKRGYVTVSLDYRLGWNPQSTDPDVRAGTIINAVYRSMQDAKTCLRYFRDNQASHGNQWGINPDRFVLGGSNSGAYTALAAGNLNNPTELVGSKFLDVNGNPYIDTTKTGNFDGFGGTQNVNNYPGISSAFNAVITLGGAIGDTTWVEAGEPAVIAFHGVAEPLTPFNTAVVVTATLQPVIEVSGPGDFMPFVDAYGNNGGFQPNNFPAGPPNRNGLGVQTAPIDGLYPFWGGPTVGFEPWNWYGTNPSFNPTASQAKAMRYIDTIMDYSIPRLYKLLIGSPVADLGSNQAVCPGTLTSLAPGLTGGVSPYAYAWAATGDALSCNNCAGPTATITQNSSYSLTVTDANNYSDTVVVSYTLTTSNLTAQPGDVSITSGSSAWFVVGVSSLNSTFQWQEDAGTGFADLANTGVYSGVTDDTLVITGALASLDGNDYRCIVSVPSSCTDTTSVAELHIISGIAETGYGSISISPNPARNTIQLNLPEGKFSYADIYEVRGAFVKRVTQNMADKQMQIDISNLETGVYFITVKADKSYRARFVKE